MKVDHKKTLRVLKSNSGKTLNFLEIAKQIVPNATKKKKPQQRLIELQDFLEYLAQFGLLKKIKKGYQIASPFAVEGQLSVARSGVSFVMGNYPTDILVAAKDRDFAKDKDQVSVEPTNYGHKGLQGQIVEISSSFTTQFLARVAAKQKGKYLIELVDQPDKKYGALLVSTNLKLDSYIFVKQTDTISRVAIPNNSGRSIFKNVLAYEVIEICDSKDNASDLKRVSMRYNLSLDFEQSVVPSKKQAKNLQKKGFADKSRKNLSRLFTFTIDGDDAKDFDDAISLEVKKDIYRLYVHIADVAHYVEYGSELDHEAFARGNSYYLRQAVIPMLPAILSEEFCSLKPKSKRLSMTCEIEFDRFFNIKNYQFYNSIIYINKRYTYAMAEKELDNKKKSPLQPAWSLASKLIESRSKKGKIDLTIPESYTVTDDDGNVTNYAIRKRLKSHRLIEECMVSANICAAQVAKKNRFALLHRIHDPMENSNLEKMNTFFSIFSIKHQVRSLKHKDIAMALKKVEQHEAASVFNFLLLRSFNQAHYAPDEKGHWGLALEDYAHFTSPIRRYADLIVHRQIKKFIAGEEPMYSQEDLIIAGLQTSRRERIALEAERMMNRLLSLRFLQNLGKTNFTAFVIAFRSSGLIIQLQGYYIEGFIQAQSFSHDSQVHNLDDFRIIIPKFSKTIALGAKLQVRFIKADWEATQSIFEIESLK